jgi:transposase InsO family protein
MAYLKAQEMRPTAFRCDQGAEFINDNLKEWLRGQGIELQSTAPYSPSQNGAAERLNRTLVELARAMMIGANVPMFLWEYALKHAAYLRERAPTKALEGKTPYEAWYGHKPDVSHTCANSVVLSMFYCKAKINSQN